MVSFEQVKQTEGVNAISLSSRCSQLAASGRHWLASSFHGGELRKEKLFSYALIKLISRARLEHVSMRDRENCFASSSLLTDTLHDSSQISLFLSLSLDEWTLVCHFLFPSLSLLIVRSLARAIRSLLIYSRSIDVHSPPSKSRWLVVLELLSLDVSSSSFIDEHRITQSMINELCHPGSLVFNPCRQISSDKRMGTDSSLVRC